MQKLIRVLVADDENVFQNTLRGLIDWEQEGFILVGFATNGKETLELMPHVQPQILITDVAMPVMDGVELTRRIKQQYPAVGVIVLSGFDNFAYVREAMKLGAFDYILKSELERDSLLVRLHQLAACLPAQQTEDAPVSRQQFLYHLIRQYYTAPDFIRQQLAQFGIALDLETPLLLAKGVCISDADAHVCAADARRKLAQAFEGERGVAVFTGEDSCYLLANYTSLALIQPVLTGLFANYPEMLWGISTPIQTLAGCDLALENFAQVEKQFFYEWQRHIFFYRPELTYRSDLDLPFRQLLNLADLTDFDGVQALIGEFLDGCGRNALQEPYHVKKTCEHVVYSLLIRFEQQSFQVDSLEAQKLLLFRKIETARTLAVLREVMGGILDLVEACVAQQMIGDLSLKQQIDTWLNANYAHEVKLSELAEHVHLTYHYLSRTFKSLYHQPFNDYVNEVRVHAAQTMLLNSEKSIGDIAEAVGFTDQGYFGKIFRKLTELSPREYRTQHRKQAAGEATQEEPS